jgi:hypothetical protein
MNGVVWNGHRSQNSLVMTVALFPAPAIKQGGKNNMDRKATKLMTRRKKTDGGELQITC